MANTETNPDSAHKPEPAKVEPQPGANAAPFSEALTEVIKNLKDNPPLLFSLGGAIILLAVGALTLESQRVIIVPLLGLLILGLVVWLLLEIWRQQAKSTAHNTQRAHAEGGTQTGNVTIGPGATAEGADLESGTVHRENLGGTAQTGDIELRAHSELKGGHLKTGDILETDDGDKPRNRANS